MKQCFLFVIVIMGFNIQAQNREADSLALLQLYQDLGGPSWTNAENWLSEKPLSEWDGIKLRNDRVNVLELKNKSINGVFSYAISQLDALTTLELSDGLVVEAIPAWLTDLENIDRLILDDIGLTGTLSLDFSKMPKLRTLIIRRNDITGPLPEELPAGANNVNFRGNNFTGTIPSSWEGIGVNTLNLSENQLTGNFNIIQTMASISTIDMSYNNWDENTFPTWVDDMTNLSWFACRSCQLVGDLPSELDFTNLKIYSRMIIDENNLTGDVSLLFSGAASTADMYLSLRENPFSGEFPTDKVIQASRIDVQQCNFSSVAPVSEGTIIEVLDLQYNHLTFTTLEPLLDFIAPNDMVGVVYENQQSILAPDTVTITEPSTFTIQAGDELPGTVYEWINNNRTIEGETGSTLVLEFTENENVGNYYCKMTHPDYPELTLRRETVKIITDITTTTSTYEDNSENKFTIYPTLSDGYIFILNDFNQPVDNIQVLDMDGRVLKSIIDFNSGMVDLAELSAGSYILNIVSKNQSTTHRFVRM